MNGQTQAKVNIPKMEHASIMPTIGAIGNVVERLFKN